MDNITITTPALFFPAVSLIMLSYMNRFSTMASIVRRLYAEYLKQGKKEDLHYQIQNLRFRLMLVKNMQAFAIICFLSCLISMYCILIETKFLADMFFWVGVIAFTISLVLFLFEIQLSTKALEIELGDMDDTIIIT